MGAATPGPCSNGGRRGLCAVTSLEGDTPVSSEGPILYLLRTRLLPSPKEAALFKQSRPTCCGPLRGNDKMAARPCNSGQGQRNCRLQGWDGVGSLLLLGEVGKFPSATLRSSPRLRTSPGQSISAEQTPQQAVEHLASEAEVERRGIRSYVRSPRDNGRGKDLQKPS